MTDALKPVAYMHTLNMELGQSIVEFHKSADPERVHGKRGRDYDESYTVTVTPLVPQRPALPAEKVREIAAAAALINAIANWERRNGSAACLYGATDRNAIATIVSDWALTNAARTIGPSLAAIAAGGEG